MSNNEQRDSAALNKWRNKLARMEDDHDHAVKNLKGFLKEAFGKGVSQTRLNLAKEVVKSERENPSNVRENAYGFRRVQDGEITGFEDDKPWERDID